MPINYYPYYNSFKTAKGGNLKLSLSQHSLFLSTLIFITATTNATDYTKEFLQQAEATVATLTDRWDTNAFTLKEEFEKCVDSKHSDSPSYSASCLEKVAKKIAAEKTKNGAAIRNLAMSGVAAVFTGALAKDAHLKNTGSVATGYGIGNISVAFCLSFDQILLSNLESMIKDAKKS